MSGNRYLPEQYSVDEIRAMEPGATLDWLCEQIVRERPAIEAFRSACMFIPGTDWEWFPGVRKPQLKGKNGKHYSTDWSAAGPLLEEFPPEDNVRVGYNNLHDVWYVDVKYTNRVEAKTPMCAIARAYVIQHIQKMEAEK